jgi:hypothetical protein
MPTTAARCWLGWLYLRISLLPNTWLARNLRRVTVTQVGSGNGRMLDATWPYIKSLADICWKIFPNDESYCTQLT